MNERDKTRLRDMLDLARKARQFAAGKTRTSLLEDEVLAFALVRALEVIGEAASRISEETRKALPQIAWHHVIGMRNKLIHDYIHIDYNIVWDTVVNDLPPLIAELEELLPPEEEQT